MPVVEIPNVGNVEFPDSMSADQIASAAAKLHADYSPKLFTGNPARNIRQQNQRNAGTRVTPAVTEQQRRELPMEQPHDLNPVNMIANGLLEVGAGGQDIGRGDVSRGASRIIRGGMEAATPVALPLALYASVPATIAGVASGAFGSKAGEAAAEYLGADPDQARLAGDVAGIAAGGYGASKIPPLLARVPRPSAQTALDAVKVAKTVINAKHSLKNAAVDAIVDALQPSVDAAEVSAPAAPAVTVKNAPPRSQFFSRKVEGTPPLFPKAKTPVVEQEVLPSQIETPTPVTEQAPEPHWDPDSVAPDPFKKTPEFAQGYEAMLRRKRVLNPEQQNHLDYFDSQKADPANVIEMKRAEAMAKAAPTEAPADSNKFAEAARMKRADQAEATAKHMIESGAGNLDLSPALKDVKIAAQLREIAKAAGAGELPKDLTGFVKDLQAKLSDLSKPQKFVTIPSAPLAGKLLQNPKALEAALALHEAMNQ